MIYLYYCSTIYIIKHTPKIEMFGLIENSFSSHGLSCIFSALETTEFMSGVWEVGATPWAPFIHLFDHPASL